MAEGCPACKALKERMGNKVEYWDVTKDELAAKIAMELGIFKVPTPLEVEDKGDSLYVCELDENLGVRFCGEVKKSGEK